MKTGDLIKICTEKTIQIPYKNKKCTGFNSIILIMVPALGDVKRILFGFINQAVFSGNVTAPEPGVILFQWFGFAGSFKWCALAFFNK